MSVLDYIQELNRQKLLAESRFGNTDSLEREFFDDSYDWLIENLKLEGGQFGVTEDLHDQMSRFTEAVLKIANNSTDYNGRVARYLADISTIQKNLTEFHATQNNIDIRKAGITPEQDVFVDTIRDAYLENGLNTYFAQPLKDLVYRNILVGMNLKQARQYLTDYIMGGRDKSGKLNRYLTQTAQQGVDSYTGMINKKLAATYTFDGYIISGSLIETSSPQCVEAVMDASDSKGFLKNSKWKEILVLAKDHGLIPGTDLTNLALNKLHWGCRHEFTPAYDLKPKPTDVKKEKTVQENIDEALASGLDSIGMNTDKKTGNFTKQRLALHKTIIDKFTKDARSKTKNIYTLGGAPANGKSTLFDSGLVTYPEGAITANADLVREMLPEYQQLVANGDHGASAFSHEESSLIGKQIINKALAMNNDFVVDGVGDGTFADLSAKIGRYKAAGNRVRADYVTLDTDKSVELAAARGRKTGRYVPEDYLLDMNKEISILVPQLIEANTFDELNLWDTNVQGKPKLILSQKNGVLTVYNQDLYNNFLNKAK